MKNLYNKQVQHTITRMVVHELVARKAITIISTRGIHTALRASTIVVLALIFTAAGTWLILPVGTVWFLVTHLVQGDAHTTPTLKLHLGITLWHRHSYSGGCNSLDSDIDIIPCNFYQLNHYSLQFSSSLLSGHSAWPEQ